MEILNNLIGMGNINGSYVEVPLTKRTFVSGEM